MRLAIVLFVSGFTGLTLTRCKSVTIREQVYEQRKENEKASEIVEKYIPEGRDRQAVKNALSKSTELLEMADKARTTAEADAKEAEADASKWRWLKGIGLALLSAGAIFGVFRLFKR